MWKTGNETNKWNMGPAKNKKVKDVEPRYPKSTFNPKGDTHIGAKTTSKFPFVELYNYTPRQEAGDATKRKKK